MFFHFLSVATFGSLRYSIDLLRGVGALPCGCASSTRYSFVGIGATAYSHALPFGPLGSACFFIAVSWIELVWSKVSGEEGRMGIAPVARKEEKLIANVSGGEV